MKYYTKLRGDSNTLYFRLKHDNLDATIRLPFVIDRSDYNSRTKMFNTDDDTNSRIIEHKKHLVKSINEAIDNQDKINLKWLKSVNHKYFNASVKEDSKTLLEHMRMFKESTSSTAVSLKLGTAISKLETFPDVLIKDVDLKWMNSFATELKNRGYANSSVNKNTALIKQLIRFSDLNEVPVKRSALSYRSLKEDTLTHYLNNDELDLIYKHTASTDLLENTRKLFLIGCYTGLRVSDLMRIQDFEIREGLMYLQMKKTKGFVAVPIHRRIASFINEITPMSHPVYNRYIKKLLKEIGINEMVEGYSRSKGNRRVFGIFPKYQVISSHSARKSFASNLYGVIPVEVIMAVGGWKTHSSLLKYIRRPQLGYAEQLKEFYSK